MPYNSPYDDYLLAIDELTGLGWWATDRNRIPGKLTIYVFVPSETRVNVADDDENLIALATLSDISLTREQGATYPEIPEAVDYSKMENNLASKGKAEFALPVGSAKRIYTSISDFRSQDARRAMAEALNARAEINTINAELSKLRQAYVNGDRAQADHILDLERNLKNARQREQNLKNKAIKIELSR